MLKTKALLKTSGFMFLKRRLFYNHSLYLDHNTLVKSKHKQIELKTQKSKATKLIYKIEAKLKRCSFKNDCPGDEIIQKLKC